jgi:ParB/RepB/Spo0J family partition protein
MNAPVAEGFLEIPLVAIAPSDTPSQKRRRARYMPEALTSLAASIKTVGVMQPVVVRKLTAMRDLASYELIAGERRWRAADMAGLAHVPAIVRDVADADLLAFQLVENLQRETISALEEAEAYRDFMQDKGMKADEVGDLVGVSRAQVYNRLKLLKLQPAVLDALESRRIDHTHALRIARVPAAKLQRKALERAVQTDHRGQQISDRELGEWIREHLMVRLDGAPFELHDATLETRKPGQFSCQDSALRNLPPCVVCDNCSKQDQDFDFEVQAAYGDEAVVCMDKPCFETKVVLFYERQVDKLRAEGRTIIDGAAAKEAKPHNFLGAPLKGYVELSDANRKALGKAGLAAAQILVDPHTGKPIEVISLEDADRITTEKGGKKPTAGGADQWPFSGAPGSGDAAGSGERTAMQEEQEKQRQREAVEKMFRRKLLDGVHERFKGPLKRDDLKAIADRWLEEQDSMGLPLYDWYYEGRIDTAKMNERELTRLLLELALWSTVEYPGDSPTALIALAKRLKIDPAKARKQAKAELGGEPEPEPKQQRKKKAKKK